MLQQRAGAGTPLRRTLFARLRITLLCFGLASGNCLLEILESLLSVILRQSPRLQAKLQKLELQQQMLLSAPAGSTAPTRRLANFARRHQGNE
jgi:hypothetical protein